MRDGRQENVTIPFPVLTMPSLHQNTFINFVPGWNIPFPPQSHYLHVLLNIKVR